MSNTPPALKVGSRRLFQVSDLYLRSPESGVVQIEAIEIDDLISLWGLGAGQGLRQVEGLRPHRKSRNRDTLLRRAEDCWGARGNPLLAFLTNPEVDDR